MADIDPETRPPFVSANHYFVSIRSDEARFKVGGGRNAPVDGVAGVYEETRRADAEDAGRTAARRGWAPRVFQGLETCTMRIAGFHGRSSACCREFPLKPVFRRRLSVHEPKHIEQRPLNFEESSLLHSAAPCSIFILP
jgi:hypothetical protein